MRLARDQHRIDDRAEVVDHEVAHDLDHAGVAVDLDLGDVAAVGKGERRVVRDVADVERLRHVGRQLQAAAQLVGEFEDADAAVGAGDDEAAAGKLDVDGRRPRARGRRSACPARSACRRPRGRPGCATSADFEPPVPPPTLSWSLSPCSRRKRSNGMPSLLAQHLGEGRGVALAVVERAAQHGDGAVGLEADAAIFLGRRPRDLEIGADAAAAQLVARRALRPALVEALPVGRLPAPCRAPW